VNNQVGAVAVEEWAPRGNGVVLELGGGLGSGTVALLDRLRARGRLAEIRRYRFTEMVPAFLRRGERTLRARFPDASFLTAEQMDMNSPLEAQGVSRGSVSLVYAVNALHVAHDLDFALREILAALQPGGRLVISECVRPVPDWPIYAEFVFNLMETFRAPRLDPRYRPNGGFLTPEQWREAMTAAGFTDIRFLPDVPALRMRFPDFNVGAIGATRPAP
jgi:SAM-dependent methyltransferase